MGQHSNQLSLLARVSFLLITQNTCHLRNLYDIHILSHNDSNLFYPKLTLHHHFFTTLFIFEEWNFFVGMNNGVE